MILLIGVFSWLAAIAFACYNDLGFQGLQSSLC